MGKKKITTDEFIKRAKEVHGGKYDYSSTNFINSKTKVKILCKKHGEFWQLPFNHLLGCGCMKCRMEKQSERQTLNTDEFIRRAKCVHNETYDYSNTEYRGAHEKVEIICKEHGSFLQTASDHLSGYGCPKCGMIKNWNNRGRMSTDEWIEKARNIHGDTYDYSKVQYVNNREKVEIICHKKYKNGEEHGSFFQKANSHLNGNGCPHCRSSSLERRVRSFLSKSNIEFEEEKTFEWLKSKSHLYLDFYIPCYNVGIECQGIQHYAPLEINGRVTLDYIVGNDKLKKRLCDENGVRIVYFTDKCIYDKFCENNGSNFFNLETMLNEIKNDG